MSHRYSLRRLIVPTMFCFTLLGALGGTASAELGLEFLGRFETGIFDDGGAEIVSFDDTTQQLFFVNAGDNEVVALDISDPAVPVEAYSIDISATAGGGSANSVDAHSGIIAVAIEAEVKQDPGMIAIYDGATGAFLDSFPAGALPDMVAFSPDGTRIVCANEGEPSDDYANDPNGSVTVVDLADGLDTATVRQIDLRINFPEVLDADVRIFGPGASVAQDLEPEYVAISADSRVAWVSLQENNAFARIDLDRGIVTDLQPLGFKDHETEGNGIDPSDRDSGIQIGSWPVFGMYQPDAIAPFGVGGETFLVSANEGDARDYDGFAEEERVKDLILDPTAFPDAASLQADEQLGRLTVTSTLGDSDGDGDYDALYAFGARSVSIWNGDGELVWDSGEDLEQITATAYPDEFNSNNDENDSFESRSDNKGPEPEGVTVGRIDGRLYAFVGLERVGGIVVYDISEPSSPEFVVYQNSRDFSGDAEAGTAGDLGPEGVEFIPASVSPTGSDLLAVGNEVSGTVALFAVTAEGPGAPADVADLEATSGSRLVLASANPFQSSIRIRYELPTAGPSELAVYDTAGRRVRTLVSGESDAGVRSVSWDRRTDDGSIAASGVYYARLQTKTNLVVRRLVAVH